MRVANNNARNNQQVNKVNGFNPPSVERGLAIVLYAVIYKYAKKSFQSV